MKRSLFNLAQFVFLAFLSVFVPAYILATGSATLLPVAQFGAALAGLGGLALAGFGAAMVYRAERHADIATHSSLIKTHAMISGIPLWRKYAVFARYAIQFTLLMAIGSPAFAAYALAGLVGLLIHRGMLDAYFHRLYPYARSKKIIDALDSQKHKVSLAQGSNGKLYAAGVGVGEG